MKLSSQINVFPSNSDYYNCATNRYAAVNSKLKSNCNNVQKIKYYTIT